MADTKTGNQKAGEAIEGMAEPMGGMTAEEEQLLFGSSDRYGIYQLRDDPGLAPLRFAGTESLEGRGITTKDSLGAIRPENYMLVHVGELSAIRGKTQDERLEEIYVMLNVDRPEGFRGRSLSVSDIVALHEGGRNSAHFVDSVGFKGLPGFMHALEDMRMKGRTGLGQEKEKPAHPAVYGHSLDYAVEHGQVGEYKSSRRLNMECREAIEDAIRQNFDGMRLKAGIVRPLADQYGLERMAFILANTIQQMPWDGRFSGGNKEWASGFPIDGDMVNGADRNRWLTVTSHPAILDGFIRMFREEALEREKESGVRQDAQCGKEGEAGQDTQCGKEGEAGQDALDNVVGETPQKGEGKGRGGSDARASLKTVLAGKKAQAAGQGRAEQEKAKASQRGM